MMTSAEARLWCYRISEISIAAKPSTVSSIEPGRINWLKHSLLSRLALTFVLIAYSSISE
jgi:hypothetical protein